MPGPWPGPRPWECCFLQLRSGAIAAASQSLLLTAPVWNNNERVGNIRTSGVGWREKPLGDGDEPGKEHFCTQTDAGSGKARGLQRRYEVKNKASIIETA